VSCCNWFVLTTIRLPFEDEISCAIDVKNLAGKL